GRRAVLDGDQPVVTVGVLPQQAGAETRPGADPGAGRSEDERRHGRVAALGGDLERALARGGRAAGRGLCGAIGAGREFAGPDLVLAPGDQLVALRGELLALLGRRRLTSLLDRGNRSGRSVGDVRQREGLLLVGVDQAAREIGGRGAAVAGA